MHMPTRSGAAHPVLRTLTERFVAAYWHHKQQALRSCLRRDDSDPFHNHCGLGDYDRSLLQVPAREREAALLSELHRLEGAQSERLLSLLGEVGRDARILDAGAGRGGTSLAAHRRFGCAIDGVDIARSQVDFANQIAADSGCAERVRFHYQNLADTEFPAAHFDRVVLNEVTMYVDLADAFRELARVLKPGGRLVLFTWCRNDAVVPSCWQASVIDANYVCHTHARSEYLGALSEHGLVPRAVLDLTQEAPPYFELRRQIRAFGGEERADEAFRTGYQEGLLQYLAVVAERAPDGLLEGAGSPLG